MGVLDDGQGYRKSSLGLLVSKAYTPLAVETKVLFNVTGLAVITAIFGVVTTKISVAGTSKLQFNPTLASAVTQDLVTATDLGTTDTEVGSLLSFDGIRASSIQYVGAAGGGGVPMLQRPIAVPAGAIEQVNATGADGGITWYLTYVPIAAGATIAAA
jgi:hypothetical protein